MVDIAPPAPHFEFFETPQAFTRFLFVSMKAMETPICGNVFEPCSGSIAIPQAYATLKNIAPPAVERWLTNDLDPRWAADHNLDAATPECWSTVARRARLDWVVTNPPFSKALAIADQALLAARVGVALHLRASIHEVLKTGVRRTWMANNTPTGILWLPRFAYQRSKTTGSWSQDSVCACWVIWLKDQAAPEFIRYAPTWVLDELEQETPIYRERMDRVMGFSGSERDRQAQRIAA